MAGTRNQSVTNDAKAMPTARPSHVETITPPGGRT